MHVVGKGGVSFVLGVVVVVGGGEEIFLDYGFFYVSLGEFLKVDIMNGGKMRNDLEFGVDGG